MSDDFDRLLTDTAAEDALRREGPLPVWRCIIQYTGGGGDIHEFTISDWDVVDQGAVLDLAGVTPGGIHAAHTHVLGLVAAAVEAHIPYVMRGAQHWETGNGADRDEGGQP